MEAGNLRQEFEDTLWNHLEREVAKDVDQWQISTAEETTPRQSLASYSTLGKLLVEATDQLPKEEVSPCMVACYFLKLHLYRY